MMCFDGNNANIFPETVQYSSSGVRQQTAELSSSFLSDSEVNRQFSPDRNSSHTGMSRSQKHDTIEEISEPVSPAGSSNEGPASSQLTEALRKQRSTKPVPTQRDSTMPRARLETGPRVPDLVVSSEDEAEATENSPLLPCERLPSYRKPRDDTDSDPEDLDGYDPGTWNRVGHHYPSLQKTRRRLYHVVHPAQWDFRKIANKVLLEPVCMLPAVFLGLLLNLLDALSYGTILFPLGEEVFKDMGPDGVSMFYVSCIISQLVYSTGSIFRGGVGSEMIEVVPFFHKMTYLVRMLMSKPTLLCQSIIEAIISLVLEWGVCCSSGVLADKTSQIMAQIDSDNSDALRATVITSYAMSSVITGIVFFILGSARLGTLVNFFPHSILTGCIGGVGIFLFITGIEVSARLDGNLAFTTIVFRKLFASDTVVLWVPPLVLAILLLTIKHFYDRPWLVPAYYIGITAIFYIITTAVPSITMEDLRGSGWVFEAPAAGVPFYNFYSYYKFSLVDWKAIWTTVPSQLALTFFGILHVPINVPNLAMVVQEDNVSINRELIMHGISNTLSGCVGSIQNYLVFVNSVLFMNTGADSRLAGYLLAAATFGLWIAGPVVIGFVPVMVVCMRRPIAIFLFYVSSLRLLTQPFLHYPSTSLRRRSSFVGTC